MRTHVILERAQGEADELGGRVAIEQERHRHETLARE